MTEETAAPREASDRLSLNLTSKRVVIVEDEGITQMQLRRTLSRAGLQVVGTASNGEEGIEVILRERPDLVLMDIRMPIMNGLDATREVLSQYKVCIVMLTAFADTENQQTASLLGVAGYVLKPVTGEILIPLLEKAYRDFHLPKKGN